MLKVFSHLTSYMAGYFGLSPSALEKKAKFKDIPIEILNNIVTGYLTQKERHLFKAVLRGITCPCYPLCQLVNNQFTLAILQPSLPALNFNFNAFYYNPSLGRIIAGDSSDYTSKDAVCVFNAAGQLQLTSKRTYWEKSVIALKQIGELIIAFSYRELGIWKADTGNTVGQFRNPFNVSLCVFSEFRKGAFVASYGTFLGYIDDLEINPWNSFKEFRNSTHKGRIIWIKEDTINGFVLSGCDNGIVNVWNLDFQLVGSIKTSEINGKYLYHSSKKLLFAAIDNASIGVWDINDGTLKQILEANHQLAVSAEGIRALAWNENENCLVASWEFTREGNLGGYALIWWNIESGEQKGNFPLVDPKDGLYIPVKQIAFHLSDLILTGGYGIKLWNKKGLLLWKWDKMGHLDRFEWDQTNKKIITLANAYDRFKPTLALINYN